MPKFGSRSRGKLETCDDRIQRVMNRAIEAFDFTIVWGHRGEAAQNEAFDKGNSKLKFPDSKHNGLPSKAIDVAPWVEGQIPWNKVEYFYILAGHIMQAAKEECVTLRWGGDWGGDGTIVKYDDSEVLNDVGHFEILGT